MTGLRPAGRTEASPVYGSRAWQTSADTRTMQALASRCWRADWPEQHFHAGDLDWWTVHAHGRTPGLEGRIRLWFAGEPDATELVGFAWFGPPSEADLLVLPGHRGTALLGPMTDWVEDRAATFVATPESRLGGLDADGFVGAVPDASIDRAGARVWMVASEQASVSALAELGYAVGPRTGLVHYCGTASELDLGTAADLPAGYSIRTIGSAADLAGRVIAGHAAFPGSTMTEEKYRFCQTRPLYRPALDTIVVGPDGSVAAFALGWLDPLTVAVELEPVGVHPDHQRRGLGRAVCRATLRAAAGLGAQQILIAAEADNPAANALYASLGLKVTARLVAFSRAAEAA